MHTGTKASAGRGVSGGRVFALLGVGSVLLALFLTYANSLDNGFHYDDAHSIVDNGHIRSLANIPRFFTEPESFSVLAQRAMFRPLVLASYAINYRLGEYRPRGYRLVNLGVHAVCVGLVIALAHALGLSPLWSGVAGMVFAFHPVQAETVNYISSRSESLAAMGYLLSLLAFIHWRAPGTSRPASGRLYALSLAAFAAGLLAKSTVVTLPAALLVYDWWRSRVDTVSGSPWRWLRGHLPFWIVAAGYVLIVREFAAAALSTPVRPLDSQLLTQAKALVYYAALVAMPVKLSIDHQFAAATSAATSAASAPVVLAAALTASLAALLLRSRRAVIAALRLPVAWAGLALLPTIVVPLNVLVNEHRLYLALAFAAIAAAGVIAGAMTVAVGGASGRAAMVKAALVACLLCLAVTSHARNYAWSDGAAIWSDALRKGPAMYRAHQELGGVLEKEGEFAAALQRYEAAARLAPQVAEVHYNRGNALRHLGRVGEAAAAYRMSLTVSSDTFVPALINLSNLEREADRLAAAKALLERARALAPENADAWRGLGILHRRQGQTAAATAAYARALELDPESAATHYNLANLLQYDQKQQEEAARHYQAALTLDAGMHAARYNLADLLVQLGRHRQAERLSAEGLRRWPGFTKLYYALARAQEGLGEKEAAVSSYRSFLPVAPSAAVRDWVRARIEHLQAP